MRVQALFDNGYSHRSRVASLGQPMRSGSVHRPRGGPRLWTVAALAMATLALAIPSAGGVALSSSNVHPLVNPYYSYSTGRVDVTLPSAQPYVELSDAQNASKSAALSVDEILEVAPASSSPQVVAVAFPSHLSTFNGSTPSGASTVSLIAALQVLPAEGAIWAGPGATVTPDGPPVGAAILSLNYSIPSGSSPGTGVAIQWTISGWPWRNSTDLLGVQLGLTTESGSGLTACSGSAAAGVAAGCRGTALTPGTTVWGSTFVGLQGETVRGPTASVGWDGALTTASGASAPVTVGALGQTGSYGHLFLGGAAGGSASVTGSISFALVNPSFPSVPLVLHGEAGWFAVSLAVFASAGLAGFVATRRQARSIEASL